MPTSGSNRLAPGGHISAQTNSLSNLKFDSIDDAIMAFKNGEFIIVLDSKSRENEGDLIIAAQDMTTEKMAFMIRHTSGLVCCPISSQVATHLSLPQMVHCNTEKDGCAYTVSVDAKDVSITTGISAHDRAFTCRALASSSSTTNSFRRPGHVFPLQAKGKGIRERQGHTEASIEFCRLAGKRPAGVLSELIQDGEEVERKPERRCADMLRADDCLKFGKKWGIKVCTIDDLVSFVESL